MKPEEAIEELNHELLILECLIEEVNSFICDCDVDDDEYDDEKEQCEISLTHYKKEKEVIEMAISALKEIQQYREIGTVEECREAVKKQKLKKPKEILRHRGGFEMQHCPKCDTDYQVDRRYKIKDGYCPACGKLLDSAFRNYCANCGQAIDENLEEMEDE